MTVVRYSADPDPEGPGDAELRYGPVRIVEGGAFEDWMDAVSELEGEPDPVLVVPSVKAFGARSVEDFIHRIETLDRLGIRLVSLAEPEADTSIPSFVQVLRVSVLIRNSGIARGNVAKAAEKKAAGERLGRRLSCGNCRHRVVRKPDGPGHYYRKTARDGEHFAPCGAPGCGCGDYTPRNIAVMGGR